LRDSGIVRVRWEIELSSREIFDNKSNEPAHHLSQVLAVNCSSNRVNDALTLQLVLSNQTDSYSIGNITGLLRNSPAASTSG
jgi:hypothetical protein